MGACDRVAQASARLLLAHAFLGADFWRLVSKANEKPAFWAGFYLRFAHAPNAFGAQKLALPFLQIGFLPAQGLYFGMAAVGGLFGTLATHFAF